MTFLLKSLTVYGNTDCLYELRSLNLFIGERGFVFLKKPMSQVIVRNKGKRSFDTENEV